ncbi:aquaporin-11-like [Salvelinus alpinus]|uniref:aquaporin-11 n=1 Tax=Salvelinus sp. IW2-2015 TaxID=2691554 RepID=UPI000CDF7A59|nr:aquaporin-11 [Salvelinus alpinus]
MTDLGISLALLATTVLLCEATRRLISRLFSGKDYAIYLVEIVSTYQLCACTHELKVLGEVGRIEPHIALTLTFIITVVHVITFHGAFANPNGAIENVYRKNITGKTAVARITCMFIGGKAAQLLVPHIWSLGLSDHHLRHKRFGFKCFSPINGSLLEAAGVELACTFAVQAAVLHIHKLDERFHAPVIAAVITSLVYSGGHISGAVFNPIMAFSVQFPCSGHTFLEYAFVYWLGPVIGMAMCILLFDKIIPLLSGKSTMGLGIPVVQKKKIQ